jgi:hypothetical protein
VEDSEVQNEIGVAAVASAINDSIGLAIGGGSEVQLEWRRLGSTEFTPVQKVELEAACRAR